MRQTLLAVMVLMVGACGGATEPEETVVAGPACDPDNGGLTLPDGFCALVAAEGLGAARHMVTAPNGDIWIACSGVDKIGRVRVLGGAAGAP